MHGWFTGTCACRRGLSCWRSRGRRPRCRRCPAGRSRSAGSRCRTPSGTSWAAPTCCTGTRSSRRSLRTRSPQQTSFAHASSVRILIDMHDACSFRATRDGLESHECMQQVLPMASACPWGAVVCTTPRNQLKQAGYKPISTNACIYIIDQRSALVNQARVVSALTCTRSRRTTSESEKSSLLVLGLTMLERSFACLFPCTSERHTDSAC